MADPTTEGYEVTAAEIDGMVRNLCAYALGEPDPMMRYEDLTHQQVLFEGIVAAIRRERGRAVADLIVAGMPAAEVATKTNLANPANVRKLVAAAGEAERVKAATPRLPNARSKAARADAEPVAAEPVPAEPVPGTPAPAAATPPEVIAPTGKRVLTAAERVALGLPV